MSLGTEGLLRESTAGPGGPSSLSVPVIGRYSTRPLGREVGSIM